MSDPGIKGRNSSRERGRGQNSRKVMNQECYERNKQKLVFPSYPLSIIPSHREGSMEGNVLTHKHRIVSALVLSHF